MIFTGRRILSILAAALALISAPSYAALTIADNGKSDYEILVGSNAFPITVRAAQDLQKYVERATGARLPITRADSVGEKPAIIVGFGGAAESLGVTPDGIRPEGFRIKTAGRNLVIAGRDTDGDANSDHWRNGPQTGTWFGVDDFLEKQLGIRWFFPGDDGEYIPKTDKLVIGELDYTDAPAMIYRKMNYLWHENQSAARIKDVKDWERHNRYGRSRIWSGSHSWAEWFPGDKYYKDHPDWFALVNGRRLAHAPYGLQMCTTNPGALDEFARVAVEYGRKYPGTMFSLSPNDSGNFCECATCRALDREKFPDGAPVLSDRIVTYANEIARRVSKVLPEQTFGLYAYGLFADPPTYAKPDPHVYIMAVLNGTNMLYHSDEFVRTHLEKGLLPWRNMTGQLFFYDCPEGMGIVDLPCMHQGILKKLFKNLSAAGITGFDMNNGTSFAPSGLNNYLNLKMAWNPDADIDAIYADALPKCYGEKGAPLIRKYFDMVEGRWGGFINNALKNQNRALGDVRTFPECLSTVYPGLYEEGMPLLKNALALTSDKGQQARINLLISNLEYTKLTLDVYNASSKVSSTGSPSKDEVMKARDAAKAWAGYVEEHKNTNLISNTFSIYRVQQGNNLAFLPEPYDFLLLKISGGKSTASVRKAPSAPLVDGDLSDAAWQDAEELPVNLRKDDASKSDVRTVARIARDASNLYIGIRCDEPAMDQVKDTVTRHRGEVWNENEVEIFFDTANSRKGYLQLLVNSLGAYADFKSENGKLSPWESNAKITVKKDAGGWTMEIAVPFASLGGEAPMGGDIWGFNICRVRNVGKVHEYTCWSPTFGLFGQPNRFGNMVFK